MEMGIGDSYCDASSVRGRYTRALKCVSEGERVVSGLIQYTVCITQSEKLCLNQSTA